MCIAVPGKVTRIEHNALGMTIGTVVFGGISKDVSLAYLPDVAVGDYVLVHVGFAIAKVDQQAAGEVFEFLKMNRELEEQDHPHPRDSKPLFARQESLAFSRPREKGN